MSKAEAALAAYARREISPEIALMRLLLAVGSAPAAIAYLEQSGQSDLLALARAHGSGLAAAAALVETGLARERTGSIEAVRDQFDRAVRLAPEAAVALYSLGSPETLERTTAELVERLLEWRLVRPDIAVLDIGCGIGRLERALAPRVAQISGTDVSPAMIGEAERRCPGAANVEFTVCDGTGLAAFNGRHFGLIVAVDAFPYLVAADPVIAARHVADAARLLEAGGALAIFNYSYRGDLAADRADMSRLAAEHGFIVERHGTRDFTLWDGATFLLRKPAALSSRGAAERRTRDP